MGEKRRAVNKGGCLSPSDGRLYLSQLGPEDPTYDDAIHSHLIPSKPISMCMHLLIHAFQIVSIARRAPEDSE